MFPQHIAKTLIAADYNYFVAEPAPDGMPAEAAAARGYGLFSARFGNVYSARQLLQLFQRAYGEFSPSDIAWRRDDGRFVDPFRPQIEPDGFADPDAVAASRERHFAAVRRMFEQSALFVFTVGLTEAWTAKSDGAVFPVAPGVISGALDRNDYQFVNFKVSEIVADLNAFIGRLRGVNHDIRLLFTVSPVPLVATYEDRHVLVSTTYSKSAIRAAVEEVVRQYDFTDYFPSYEIITGWYNKGRYFDADLRSVTPEGVAHVMRLFSAHYLQSAPGPADAADRHAAALKREIAHVATIICDEELLGRGHSTATSGPLKTPKVEKSPYANAFAEPDAGRGGIDAPDWIGERLPADGGDTRIGPFAARIREMEVQLLALREALARETASRENEVLRVTEQTAEQARQTAVLRKMVGDTVDLIGVLRTENDDLREEFDQIAHGVETWLLPTLEGHAAAIRRGRHPLRKLGRRAVRATGFFLGLRRSCRSVRTTTRTTDRGNACLN